MNLPQNFVEEFEKTGFYLFPAFINQLDTDEIVGVIGKLAKADMLKKAGIGKLAGLNVDSSQRSDLIHWIGEDETIDATAIFLLATDELIIELNRHLYLGIRDMECHYTSYPSGAFYKKHVDRHHSGSTRVVSFVLYLNKNWKVSDGGQLRVYRDNQSFEDAQPHAGTLAIFLSGKEHEVLVTNRERMSITGWMLSEKRL